MDRHTNDLYDRCTALRQRSARLRADIASLHNQHRRIKEQMAARCEDAPVTGGAMYLAPPAAALPDWPADDPQGAAREVLRVIHTLIDPFPLEWQVAIVKALTARTLLKAHERTQPAPTTLSA